MPIGWLLQVERMLTSKEVKYTEKYNLKLKESQGQNSKKRIKIGTNQKRWPLFIYL